MSKRIWPETRGHLMDLKDRVILWAGYLLALLFVFCFLLDLVRGHFSVGLLGSAVIVLMLGGIWEQVYCIDPEEHIHVQTDAPCGYDKYSDAEDEES